MNPPRKWNLYVITDRRLSRGRSHEMVIRSAILGGADVIQFREKDSSTAEMYREACLLRTVTRELNIPFLINDRLDIALAVDADGVHLGQDDLPVSVARRILGPEKIIGISTHSLDQVRAAAREAVDYIAIGPIFPTQTKQIDRPLGVGLVSQAKAITNVPLVVIGGINEKNIDEVFRAGADIAAVISAVVNAEDIEKSTLRIKQRIVSSAAS